MKLFAKFAKRSPGQPESGIGFGCMGITSFYGAALEDDAASKLLQTVYDSGCRHFDTAEMYSNDDPNKHNEIVVGRFLKTVPRDSYSIATKYWPANGNYDYDTVKDHLLQSLERLQLDHVDLYYAHRVMSLQGGLEFAKVASKLKQEGLIKEVGLSEVSGQWLSQICTEYTIDAVQQEWSILTRNLEDDLVPVCKANNITIVAYSPLCRNLLVQKHETLPSDWRATLPRYQNMQHNRKFTNQVFDIAQETKCTPAQVCLVWLFQKASELGVSVVPIPGTTKPDRAMENIQSVDNVSLLSKEHLETLNEMAKHVVGDRYMKEFMGNGLTIESQK